MSKAKTSGELFMVLRAYDFGKLLAGAGGRFVLHKNSPQRVIPVFNTYKQALKFAGGDKECIKPLEVTQEE